MTASCPFALTPDLAAGLVAVHARHADVEKDQVGLELGHGRDRRRAVVHGLHLVPEHLQHHRETRCQVNVIVDDQDAALVARGPRRIAGSSGAGACRHFRAARPAA